MIGEAKFYRGGTDWTSLERQMTDIVGVANNFLLDQQEYKQNKQDQKNFLYRRKARHCRYQRKLLLQNLLAQDRVPAIGCSGSPIGKKQMACRIIDEKKLSR